MRTRFGSIMALVLLAALPAFAQHPGEGQRPSENREQYSTGLRLTVPVLHAQIRRTSRRRSATPTPDRSPSTAPTARSMARSMSPTITGTATTSPTTSAFTMTIRSNTVILNTLAPTTVTPLLALTVTTIASGSPAASTLKSLLGTGLAPPSGAGIVATTSPSMRTPITRAGTCSTTSIRDTTST